MSIQKLTSTDAFIAFDFEDAPSSGIVRCARKILQGGASDLARSLTYSFATFGVERGGASAGINAVSELSMDAIAAFVDELTPMVTDGKVSFGAGKGVDAASLSALSAADHRHEVATTDHEGDDLATHLAALGPVLAASKALGGLDGKRIAIEGFGATGPAIATLATTRGARVVALSTTKGSMLDTTGFDATELRESWAATGVAMVGDDADPAWKVLSTPADALLVGSKMGAINHETAAALVVQAVVPHAPLAYTARALAVMQQSEIAALPDFICTAAPMFAWWPTGDATPGPIVDAATAAIEEALDETLGHAEGGFLGACYRAEAFLGTWREVLPFGRPLAS